MTHAGIFRQVAFLRDGLIVHLGRSFRQAHDEVTRAGDNDIYLHNPRIMANDLRNLGVLTSDRAQIPHTDPLPRSAR
jgi:hypothetical protein